MLFGSPTNLRSLLNREKKDDLGQKVPEINIQQDVLSFALTTLKVAFLKTQLQHIVDLRGNDPYTAVTKQQ